MTGRYEQERNRQTPRTSGASGSSPQDSSATDQARQTVDRVRRGAQQTVRNAEEQANRGAEQVASTVERAAGTLRQQATDLPGGDMTTEAANRVAGGLEQGARYLHDKDVAEMGGDLQRFMRRYPMQTLAVGMVIGFLAARALGGGHERDRYSGQDWQR